MNHSPLADWADKKAYRWPAIGAVILVIWMGSGALADAAKKYDDLQRAYADAQEREQRDVAQQNALQAACGGPEATVVEAAHGGYYCLDTNGRRTKTIPGLARPVSQGPQDAARVFGARLQLNFECANSIASAGLVPAGFLKG